MTTVVTVVAVLGLLLGGVALIHQHALSVRQAALADCLSAEAIQASETAGMSGTVVNSPVTPTTSATQSQAAPCPSASGSAAATVKAGRVPVAPGSFAAGPAATRQLGDVSTTPVDGQGNVISLTQTPAQAAASGNCTLIVPADPLTAPGLATPFQLGDGCSEANPDLQAFAEATILSPDGQVTVYNPLVITQGTTPGVSPLLPTIPSGSAVILDFGFNGTNLVLTGPGAFQQESGCVDALGQSVIGQVSACNAVPFYQLANEEIANGTLKVPSGGPSLDGQACQDTRDFALVDQDPSNNTYTQYLLNGSGQTAQPTPANKAAMGSSVVLSNDSDNGLLGNFVDPANGCQPFAAPDLSSASQVQSSQALDELSARVNQRQPIALVPTNDEMVLVDAGYSLAKTNVYRSLTDQPLLTDGTNPAEVAAAFCANLVDIAPARDELDQGRDANFTSPAPHVGTNLATFLGHRLSMSFANLGCQAFGLTDPVNVTVAGNGAAIAVSYNVTAQQATIPASEANQGN